MNFETMTVQRIEYHELESHIRQVYGFEDPKRMFSVVAMEEWRNDSDHIFHMEKKTLDRWEQEVLDKWKANPLGFHQYVLSEILQDMVNDEHLPEGDLLIAVCW